MNSIIKARYDKSGVRTVEALKKRHFEAYYCSTRKEAIDKVLALIPTEDVVSWGGTATVNELGIKDRLRERGQKLIDRDAVPAAERQDAMRRALTCDTFLMSANAITEDGQLMNMDGNGNRVAALCFGPKSVIVVAGMNKVVADVEAAYSRVRHYAAPVNTQRFDVGTPCEVTGNCADCISPESSCVQLVLTRLSRPVGRVKVVLVGEELGY